MEPPTPIGLDGLDAFGSEAAPAVGAVPSPVAAKAAGSASQPRWIRGTGWAAVALVIAVAAGGGSIVYQRRFLSAPATGMLTVETSPADLEVVIAGRPVGRTPLTLPLAAGAYEVRVGAGDQQRTLKVSVVAGIASVQHVEFVAPSPAVLPETGTLRIQTEPSKLAVVVDGVHRGWSPLTVERLAPGHHDIAVRTDRGAVHRSVKLQPRETLSLLVSTPPVADAAAATGGWLMVSSPIALQLREAGKVIGTTELDRVMLPAGDHEVEMLNEPLGFRVTRTVRIAAGKTATTRVDLPNGTLSVNAQPWAEVWIDGERVGETPIGNLQRPIGTHQVVFRHPDLGERRESVVITLLQPARLGVDLRKK
jgi:PEGA domain